MNKNLIKKIAFIVVCIALIVSAAILSLNVNGLSAGAGNGKSAKIETIDGLSSVIEDLNKRLGYRLPSVNTSEEEYKSFTLYQTSVANYNDSLSFSRELTLFATENASYYITDCTVESESGIPDNKNTEDYDESVQTKTFINFRAHIYMEKDFVMLCFDKYDAVYVVKAAEEDNEVDYGLANSNIYKVLGKWLYISADEKSEYGEMVSMLNSINSSNFDVFGVIARYLRDDSLFKKDGKQYTLLKDYSQQFIDDLLIAQFGNGGFSDESDKASFTVDLSNKTEPQMKLSVNRSSRKVQNSDDRSQSIIFYNASSYDLLTFKNINNTVIKTPNTKNALSFEEFVEIVEG